MKTVRTIDCVGGNGVALQRPAVARELATRSVALAFSFGLLLVLPASHVLLAHEPPRSEEVRFAAPVADVAGTMLVPHAHAKVPCVVIVGGTMSHTRDGGLVGRQAPPRDALKRLAQQLVQAGYASLRYDRVGFGGTKPNERWTGSYHDEAAIVAAAIRFARGRSEVGKVIVAGESAGAYLACLAAKERTVADAYLFLGGLCGPPEEMYDHAFGTLARYAESSPDRLTWAMQHARDDLILGRRFREMLAAAAAGKSDVLLVDADRRLQMGGLARRREELAHRPDEMFRHIRVPALALAGDRDLNVPPSHAARAVEIMRTAGNENATSITIPGADHSFQQPPSDDDSRIRERYTFESFRRPYEPRVYREIVAWLQKTLPTPAEGHGPDDKPLIVGAGNRAKLKPELDAKTDTTPERLQLAPGIEIVDDITVRAKTAGVPTLEGRIGPLLLADGCQAHFIDMPAGAYVEEHPHSSESIIYTVRGRWVLCSQGRRHLMKPGTLFRFTANTPTGYEVPFTEDAYILIFKGDRTTKVESEFIDYLKGMAGRLEKEHKEGVPYLLRELPRDHAARAFARKVNPRFEEELEK